MGGKSKQAQRTKNNVRPSSSGRSAEQLCGLGAGGAGLAGGLAAGLGAGLGSGLGGAALFPSLAAAAHDAMLPTDFALAFKKLNKKDPITKSKALQELTELVQNSKVDDVVAALPCWTHAYRALALEHDRKVRELTQACHGAICAVSGRRLAPQLRALLPVWLTAQYDDHAPAMTRAQRSLHSTFPENKLPDAISFCKEEILSHLIDSLLDTNAAIGKRVEGEEERAAAAERVTAACLAGLRYVCAGLPRGHDAWLWGRLQPLVTAQAFWKLASHGSASVRGAWYGCAAALAARHGGAWGALGGGRALRALLAAREPRHQPRAALQHWDALLQHLHADPDWYERLEKKDALTKKIVETLAGGGWGDARRLADTLLPLLALLPPDLLTAEFYAAFFDACFAGFEKKNISSSKSERAAWIASVAECVRYVSLQAGDAAGAAAVSAHRAWARAALQPRDPAARAAAARLTAAHMAGLFRSWLRLPAPDTLVRAAWQNLAAVMLHQLDDLDAADAFDVDAFAALLDTHALFLRTLKTSYAQAPKARPTIKFEDEPKSEEDPPSETTTTGDSDPPSEAADTGPAADASAGAERAAADAARDAAAAAHYAHNLEECVRRVVARAVKLAAERNAAAAVARALPPLLDEFASRALLTAVGEALGDPQPAALYHRALLAWLREPATRAPPVLDLAFQVMRHLTDDERDQIYATFEQAGSGVCGWAVCASAAHPACGWAAARRWLRSAGARAALLRAVGAAPADAAARTALLACLSAPLLAAPAAAATLRALAAALAAAPHPRTASLSAQLAAALAAPAPPDGYEDLLLALFRLTLHRQPEEVSSETEVEARGAWQDGLLALAPPHRDVLAGRMLELREKYLQESSEELELSRIEHATSLCAYMVDPDGSAGDVATILQRVLAAPEPAQGEVLVHALRHDTATGRLACPAAGEGLDGDVGIALRRVVSEAGDNSPAELTRAELRPLCRNAVARAVLLRAVTRTHATATALFDHEPVRQQLLHLLHDHALLCSLKDGYAFWPHYEDIVVTESKLDALLTDMLSECSLETAGGIRAAAAAAAAARGHYWAYACVYAARKVKTEGEGGDDVTELDDTLTGDGFFHTVQAEAAAMQADEEIKLHALQLCAARALLCVLPRGGPAPALHAGGNHALAPLDAVVDAHYRHPENMLYDTDISSAVWSRVSWAAAAARLAARGVAAAGWDAAPRHWDFLAITLASLLHALHASSHAWGCTKVAMVWCSVVELLEAVVKFVEAVPEESTRRQPAAHVAALPAEWRDVFRPDVTAHVYRTTLHVLENAADRLEITVCQARVVSCLSRAVRALRWERAPPAPPAPPAPLPPPPRAAAACARVLAARAHAACKYLAYYTLRQLEDPLVLEDAEKLRAWAPPEPPGDGEGEGEEEGAGSPPPPRFLLHHYHEPLLALLGHVEGALAGPGAVPANADSESESYVSLDRRGCSAALGLLLLWDALCAALRRARGELAAQYTAAATAARYVQRLLPAALQLLPPPLAHLRDPPPPLHHMFLDVPPLEVDEPMDEALLQWLSCRAVFTGVSGAWAGGARAWRGAAAAPAGRLLSRLVAAYVAPELIERQFSEVLTRANELEDADVGVHRSTREVWCVVRVEESGVELRVWLSAEHPLVPPRVEAPTARHSAAPAAHWLAVYLAYQNGSVLAALKMWARAVSARVGAAPQCYICYCRLQPGTGRLPSVPCRQCRNKFHNLCLRKWFVSSNKSNCPLCRATF